ncbi:MBL fold metallo-hydrolase [Pedobacter sp. PACM 27299]|uniref:MBL fold metallo-hydrolase n=1 Tax=Pedobacter sp. PACM 27299 TaxID=1727164 RepID=UPI000A606FBC|nr:MBL fold metallo-hydrolase [Pedobacter sp. PACM 27299]
MKKMILGIALVLIAISSYGQSKNEKKSSVQLIRNATVVYTYGGKEFLIDPMLAKKGAYPGFEGTANAHLRNPMVELPVSAESLLNPDAIIVTHTHPDHWDEAAIKMLPKEKTLYAQNQQDAETIRSQGFKDVRILSNNSNYENITLQKTFAQHGSDAAYANPQIAEILGHASGVFFSQPGQKSVYFAGDAIWTKDFESHLKKLNPSVVVLNTGYAQVNGFGAIIMGKEDVNRVHQILPNATIIAVHMEAINHCVLTRKELMDYVKEMGISDKVIIPADGQVINF